MSDDLDVLSRLVDYHDHIAPPMVPVADDVRRGRRRVRRNRGTLAGGIAAGVAGVLLATSLITGGDRDAAPAPATPTPVTPSPTATRSQSPQTWADTPVSAAKGYQWKVPDPLQAARDAWFAVVTEHLDPTGRGLQRLESSAYGVTFERPAEGSDYAADTASTSAYSTSGRVGLIVDSGQLTPLDGCRYLMDGPAPSNGTESCSDQRILGPDGEPATIARWGRRCGAYEGGGPAPATCGDYRVEVAVARRDGLIGYVNVEGRGTPDFNPFDQAAMAAAAADPRLVLPESAFAVPSTKEVTSVIVTHLPTWRAAAGETPPAAEQPGYARAWGHLGRIGLSVAVWPAGDAPTCGRSWLLECVERRVYGADDPTTVFVGAWDEDDWADCCPRNSRATSRQVVYVGPRHTVVVGEFLVVKEGAEPVSADLDQRLIELALDPRLQ